MKLERLFSLITILVLVLSCASVPNVTVSAASGPVSAAQPVEAQPLAGGLAAILAFVRSPSALLQCMTSGDCPHAILELSKTADAASVPAGSPIGFTITASNTGNYPAYSVIVKDQLDPQITWSVDNTRCSIDANNLLSCTYWTLDAGTSQSAHVTAVSTPEMCGTLKNVADVSATHFSNIEATASIDIECGPHLVVTKAADAPTVQVNSPIGFTITVTNDGKTPANDVQLKDQLNSLVTWTVSNNLCSVDSAGLLTCAFGVLAVGSSADVHVTAQTTTDLCGSQENTATAWASNHPEVESNTVSVNVECQPGLSVTKAADATSINAGDLIGFTLTVTNNGQAKAAGVTLQDQLSSLTIWSASNALCSVSASGLLTCSFGDLAPSASATVHVSATSNTTMCGTLDNTATATAAGLATVTSNKVSVNIGGCESNLTVRKTADAEAINAGDTIGFTVSVANTGLNPANDVRLEDQLSNLVTWTVDNDSCSVSAAGLLTCGFGTLDPGGSASVHMTAKTTTEMCGTLDNTATAWDVSGVRVNSNKVTVTINCGAALKVLKTADDPFVEVNDPIGFTITVTNTGLETATGVKLEDQLSTLVPWTVNSTACSIDATSMLTCSFGTLAVGASVSIHVASVSSQATCGEMDNTATAWGDDLARVASNASIIVTHCGDPVLTVVKTADAARINAGDPIGFTIEVGNTGQEAAYSVQLEDQLNNMVTWSVDNTGCTVNNAGLMTCSLGNVAPGETVKIHVMAKSSPVMCGTQNNIATVWAINNDRTQSNTATVFVNCGPALTVIKTADADAVNVNETIGFTITVQNVGQAPAIGVQLEDQLNNLVTWTVDNTACTINASTGMMTCSFGDLSTSGSVTVHVSAKSGTAVCGEVSNTATAWATNHERVTSEAAVVVVTCGTVDISLVKDAEVVDVFVPRTARFILTVTNHADATAANVQLNDPLPVLNGVVWTIDAGSAQKCSIAAGVLSCKFGSMAPGKTLKVTVSSPTSNIKFTPGSKDPLVLNNTATVTATNEPAANTTDNTDSALINVFPSQPVCQADGIYKNNFNTSTDNDKAGWMKYITTKAPKGQIFLGELTNESNSLGLTCLPAHKYLRVSFDLYIIRSWDGNAVWSNGKQGPGPDRWQMSINGGPAAIDTTFSNWSFFKQAYTGVFGSGDYSALTGSVGKNTLGFKYYTIPQDATYHIIVVIPHEGPDATLNFDASGLQIITDESWGLDNLVVTAMPDSYKVYFPAYNGVP